MVTNETENLGILWGATSIGRFINKGPRATYHLLETGKLPGRKTGKVWTATKRELAATFCEKVEESK